MFNAISWGQYFLAVCLLLVAYYTYVLAVYYRQEISALVKGRVAAVKPRQVGPEKPASVATPILGGTSPLIVPSLVVAPALPQLEESVQQTDDESESPATEDSVAEEDTGTEEQAPVAEVDDVALEVETGADQSVELEDNSSLIEVVELSEFVDKVECGEFTKENAKEAPATLENTALLQDIFTASLARRRASLAVLEDA